MLIYSEIIRILVNSIFTNFLQERLRVHSEHTYNLKFIRKGKQRCTDQPFCQE